MGAQILANSDGILSVLKSWEIFWPLGALFRFDEEIDELFS